MTGLLPLSCATAAESGKIFASGSRAPCYTESGGGGGETLTPKFNLDY